MYDSWKEVEQDIALMQTELNALRERIVLCRDCKYWEVDTDVGFCARTEDCDWNADDFCSKGVKKDESIR